MDGRGRHNGALCLSILAYNFLASSIIVGGVGLVEVTDDADVSDVSRDVDGTLELSLGAFCAGTVLSWTSPALPYILENVRNGSNLTSLANNVTTPPGFLISEHKAAIVGSMLTIGALMSAIPIGYAADKFGRKPTILGLSLPFFLNYILITFAKNLETIIAARFFAGIGLGGICVVAPMYIGEISEPSNRGTLGSFVQLFLSSGILFTSIVATFTNWTSLSLTLAAAPVVFGVSFLFMPDTPVYLIENNKMEKAEKTLKTFRGSNYDVSRELKTIQKEMEKLHQKTVTIRTIVTNKGNLRAIISVLGVLAFQQLSGINAMVFYTTNIFHAAGTNIAPNLAAIIVNLVQVIVSYISILIIEKAGRKYYLMVSSVGMLSCLAGLGMFFQLKSTGVDVSHLGFMPLGSLVLYMVSFSIGYGPVPWMLISELFSPDIKGVASGLAILANWIFAFVVTFSFPIMRAALGGHVTFYIFALIMGCATLFVYFIVPETRGKSLIEIQEELNR
ncbi:hypothetical protein NQ317_003815 [Molorchus minor]|uniref:Major facilitator superfamily (MFS) profile domain-containing protein n=1 Tax=Molorchus minor TaxID=1323400 RepID=A0ABQ9JI86_9CUCU|nr:hypothetical protein NQ317_003815 [Molorchus minor]